MANFRRAHDGRTTGGGKMIVRIILAALFVAGLLFASNFFKNLPSFTPAENTEDIPVESQNRLFLPTVQYGTLIHHSFYSLSYAEENEQAEWVAYELTREKLQQPWVSRTDDFRIDPDVKTGSSAPEDFKNSGYDRGHLTPAGDMAFSEKAMSETFLMSNISPQVRAFNHGIWRESEELTRDWAKKFGHLYVVSGPIFGESRKTIGKNKVTVPEAYFRVLLDLAEPEKKGIAFIIPNESSNETLDKFAVSIDAAEEQTGFDFFHDFMKPDLEGELESHSDPKLWPLNEKKYKLRVEKWNHE